MLFGTILETMSIGIVFPIVSFFTDNQNTKLNSFMHEIIKHIPKTEVNIDILIVCGLIFLLFLIKTMYLIFFSWYQAKFIFNLRKIFSVKLFEFYMKMDYQNHLNINSSILIRNSTIEVDEFISSIKALFGLCTETLITIALIGMILFIEPVGAIIVLIVLGTGSLVIHNTTKKYIQLLGEQRQYYDGKRVMAIQQGVGGIKEIKALSQENYFKDIFSSFTEKSSKVGQYQHLMQALPRLLIEFLIISCIVVVVFFITITQPNTHILPVLILFMGSTFRLLPSINRILLGLQVLKFSSPSINKIYDDLNISLKIKKVSKECKKIDIINNISFKEISFSFDSSNKIIFSNLNMTFKIGEIIGIKGKSGAGKSTFVDIISGLLKPISGSILIDSKNVELSSESFNHNIGYVPQQIFLLDDTIKNNILFGERYLDDNLLEEIIHRVGLKELISELPNGYDTMVGERGARLSGGQLQRIGIARALCASPKLLILDEATSALDENTAKSIFDIIQMFKKSMIIIIISHQESSFDICDKVFELNEGKITNIKDNL